MCLCVCVCVCVCVCTAALSCAHAGVCRLHLFGVLLHLSAQCTMVYTHFYIFGTHRLFPSRLCSIFSAIAPSRAWISSSSSVLSIALTWSSTALLNRKKQTVVHATNGSQIRNSRLSASVHTVCRRRRDTLGARNSINNIDVHVEQPPTSENAFSFRGTVETVETPGYEVRMHACIPARPTRRAPLTEQNVCPSVL